MTVSSSFPKLEPLLARIHQDAREEADRVVTEAQGEAERALAEARDESEAEAERIKTEAMELNHQREAAEEADACRRGRFQRLALKNRLMEEAFQVAQASVRGSSKEAFHCLTEALVVRYAVPGALILIVDPADRPWLDEPFLRGLQSKLEGCHRGSHLADVQERPGLGGGIILGVGRREIDVSLTSLFAQLQEAFETELLGMLFPSEKSIPAEEGARAVAR